MSGKDDGFSVDLLRTYVQDGHISFLIGAGTSASYFPVLGGVEDALEGVEAACVSRESKDLARASLVAHFLKTTLVKNRDLLSNDPTVQEALKSHEAFSKVVNRVLLRRKSTLLEKRACIFTTNVDLMFEIGFDRARISLNDGFSGRFNRLLDTAGFGGVQFRTSVRYDRRSEIPTFDLLKLHGSVDWNLGESADHVVGDPTLRALAAVEAALSPIAPKLVSFKTPSDVTADRALSSGRDADDDVREFLLSFDRLALVLPEKTKFASTLLSRTYYELLRRFANELERENSLLLVHGFSFRDEHVRDLVLRAARTNPTLQAVIFCYSKKAADDIHALLPEEETPSQNFVFVTGDELDLARLTSDWLQPLVPDDGAPTEDSD